jgi:hypothetical protein
VFLAQVPEARKVLKDLKKTELPAFLRFLRGTLYLIPSIIPSDIFSADF